MQFTNAEKGSLREAAAAEELARTILHRKHLDDSVKLIGEILFENSVEKLNEVRPAGTVLVDDWACLKAMVSIILLGLYILSTDIIILLHYSLKGVY